ncbi:hypothetical protein T440DRAFT_518856 [Plenodomus tracheiphilus IPT5]|uniref:Uncharacterized protein n=1 Tax=Plenodomus tracheiphilus IPT5 TaxID=1408161 RepID=A0A6A7B5G2_9PLEO|nr:hypothetical protein T440DRAFT_518856 [Plenodomus tracheiphilus IPT5]
MVSCKDRHERDAYNVPGVLELTDDSVTLEIIAVNYPHRLRENREIRRQEPSDKIVAAPNITQAAPTPLDSAAPISTLKDLATTIINRVLPLPSGSPIEVACLECSISGSTDFVSAGFAVRGPTLDDFNVMPDLVGSASVTAHGIKAHLKLPMNFWESWQFMSLLFLASTNSIRTPGIGAASIRYGPFLTVGFGHSGTLALTQYGFDMEVSDGAATSISLDTTTVMTWSTPHSLYGFQAGIDSDTPILNATARTVFGVKKDCSSGDELQNLLDIDFTWSWRFEAYFNVSYNNDPVLPSADFSAAGESIPNDNEKQCRQYDAAA